ncbi:MAG TPA: hydrogenase maturation protease [Bryobacteraceae bacterium]|nr:hydrogenase maturation protease [Bryobacteraceae bacterium]
MTSPRILIACIGNIFLGDDGFGVEVARRLSVRPLPPGVLVQDFGIRSLDLTYVLLDTWDLVILVDATPFGGEPGDVCLIQPDSVDPKPSLSFDAHSMNPVNVLRAVKAMGGPPNRILIVGCEPASCDSDDDGRLGLSEPVAAAVDDAIALIDRVIEGRVVETSVGSV